MYSGSGIYSYTCFVVLCVFFFFSTIILSTNIHIHPFIASIKLNQAENIISLCTILNEQKDTFFPFIVETIPSSEIHIFFTHQIIFMYAKNIFNFQAGIACSPLPPLVMFDEFNKQKWFSYLFVRSFVRFFCFVLLLFCFILF